jgi:hypothetical protein
VGVCNEHLQWVFVMRVSKKFYLCGRLPNAPTQHTLKAIDYRSNQLCQNCEPHGQETLAKYSDVKSNLRLFGQSLWFLEE